MQTQIERFAIILKDLKPDVTEADRVAASETLGFAVNTISQYMNGKGTNNDTAFKLIKFFRGRIAERDRNLGIIPSESNLVSS